MLELFTLEAAEARQRLGQAELPSQVPKICWKTPASH